MNKRPMPPDHLANEDDLEDQGCMFAPAKDVWPWIEENILYDTGSIHNPDHIHLIAQPGIEVLWADYPYAKQGRRVIGLTEKVMFRAGGWQKARQERQMMDWFGYVPEYLITFAAAYCRDCSDVEFCRLVEHELYHIAHAIDKQNGALKFSRDTGMPKLEIRGHDVEEFVGVVERYGASVDVQRMVDAANNKPKVSLASTKYACGTCTLKLA